MWHTFKGQSIFSSVSWLCHSLSSCTSGSVTSAALSSSTALAVKVISEHVPTEMKARVPPSRRRRLRCIFSTGVSGKTRQELTAGKRVRNLSWFCLSFSTEFLSCLAYLHSPLCLSQRWCVTAAVFWLPAVVSCHAANSTWAVWRLSSLRGKSALFNRFLDLNGNEGQTLLKWPQSKLTMKKIYLFIFTAKGSITLQKLSLTSINGLI